MPDVSKMSSMRELYLCDSFKLTEIIGLDKSLNSMTRIHMEGCTNLTAQFRNNIMQGWASCGYGGIFLNGNDIPDRFDFVSENKFVYFTVPQSFGRSFTGLTLSFVYSLDFEPKAPITINITNFSQGTDFDALMTHASLHYLWKPEEHYLWQGQLSNDVLQLQEMDEVRIHIVPHDDFAKVKKTGVSLVWDKLLKENMIDYNMCGYEHCPSQNLVNDYAAGPTHLKIYSVGITSRVRDLSDQLDIELSENFEKAGGSTDVRMIGIWGMGGIGKTTLAKAICKKFERSFDGKSFLENVRGVIANQPINGLVGLQNQLLNDILKSKDHIKVDSVDVGITMIRARLCYQRALVIIDDVDEVQQVKAIAGDRHWFGPGSRIIIITRDEHLLERVEVDKIYAAKEMDGKEALGLFSWHAFKRDYPDQEYVDLSNRVICCCQGLPLALKVLGSFLNKRTTAEWESHLERLERSPDATIQKVLRISFENTHSHPKKFSRLRKCEDITDVLSDESLHEKLKILDLSHSHLTKSADFSELPNLEGLILKGCRQLSEVDSSIGDLGRLSLVNLEDCSMLENLPLNFYNSQSIETLLLNGCSHFGNLPDGLGDMVSLKTLEVANTDISQIPSSIVKLKNLEVLSLCGLKGFVSSTLFDCLRELHLAGGLNEETFSIIRSQISFEVPSLSGLSKLQYLSLNDCMHLRAIPDLPTNLKVLKAIGCPALETIPDFSKMSNMRELYLRDSFKLTEVPGLDKSLNSMTRIHMEGCTNLTAEFRKNILQGWTSSGYGGIFLNGIYDIPEWFEFVDDVDNQIYFEVSAGRDLKGLTISFVYTSDIPKLEDSQGPIGIIVRNFTRKTALHTWIAFGSVKTSSKPEDHYLWQGQLSNDMLRLQGGDQVSILVRPIVDFVRVKKTGVHLEWDKLMKENMNNPDPHLYDLEPYLDFLGGTDDEAEPSHDTSVPGDQMGAIDEESTVEDDPLGRGDLCTRSSLSIKENLDFSGGADDGAGWSQDAFVPTNQSSAVDELELAVEGCFARLKRKILSKVFQFPTHVDSR